MFTDESSLISSILFISLILITIPKSITKISAAVESQQGNVNNSVFHRPCSQDGVIKRCKVDVSTSKNIVVVEEGLSKRSKKNGKKSSRLHQATQNEEHVGSSISKNTKIKEKPEDASKRNKLSSSDESISNTVTDLEKALRVHPFKIWKLKNRFASMIELGVDESQLQSIIKNKWDSERMKSKLEKVFKGEDIHLAILGGSNSVGGGIQEDEGDTRGVFYRVISHWWRNTILPITGSHLKIRQASMGGTSSDFFQYCYENFIQPDVDIALIELSVNDLKAMPPHVNLSLPIEQLTRQLLEYHSEPSVLYVNLFSGRTYYQGCMNLEDFGQKMLSDRYSITTFNWRDAVCPIVMGKYRTPLGSCHVICKDGHHINLRGHAHVSLMIINFFRDLLLKKIIEKSRKITKRSEPVLPEPVFIRHNHVISQPRCWTLLTPNYLKFKAHNSLNVGVMSNYGFDFMRDKVIGQPCKSSQGICRTDRYSGWSAKDAGATIQFSFTVPPYSGERGLHTRSVVFATRTCEKCGAADIWLDDDYPNKQYVLAKSAFAQTYVQVIGTNVDPGDHTMTVQVMTPGEVTIVGVMIGPQNGPY